MQAGTTHKLLLLTYLKDLLSYIKKVDKSRKSEIDSQTRKVLNEKIDRITSKFKQLIMSKDFTVFEKFEILMEGIGLLRQILNYHPSTTYNKKAKEITWNRLYGLFFLFLGQITNYYGKRQELQLVATAEVLGNILSGLEIIDPLEIFDEKSSFVEGITVLTIAYSQFFLYSRIIEVIYDVSENDFYEWSRRAVQSAYYLFTLIDIIIDKNYLCRDINKDNHEIEFLFLDLNDIVQIPFLLARFFIELAGYFYQEWPEQLRDNPFGVKNYRDFISLIKSMFSFGHELYNKLIDIKNDIQCEHCFNWDENIISSYLGETLTHNIILSGTMNISISLEKGIDTEYQFYEVANNILSVLEDKSIYFSSPEYVNSDQGEKDYPVIKWFAQIIGFISIAIEQPDIIKEFEKRIFPFIDWNGTEKFPDIKAILTISKLVIALEKLDEVQIDILSDELLVISNYYQYKLRDALSFRHLGLLCKVVLGLVEPEILVYNLQSFEGKLLEVKYESMLVEYRQYIYSLMKAINEGKTEYFSLWRIEMLNVFVPYSLLIPDFTRISEKKGYGSIFYLPFNLKIDKIRK